MSSWSYSAYSSAVRCLRHFKLCYVDKIVTDAPDSGDLLFGSALHSAINASLTGGDGALTFEIFWDSHQKEEVDYGRLGWTQLRTIGTEFIRKFEKSHRSRYVLKFGEKRLFAEYGGVTIEGSPDFIGDYDGRPALRDFKTSSRNYPNERKDTALQLYLYSYLAHQSGLGLPETLGYTVFNKGVGTIQDLTWEFKKEDMISALDNMSNYVKMFDAQKEFPKNPNACDSYNRKCEYFNLCFPK